MYGAADQWNGVGIFFDSFDNDGKVGEELCHDSCVWGFMGVSWGLRPSPELIKAQ